MSARLVRDAAHLREIVQRLTAAGVHEAFVPGRRREGARASSRAPRRCWSRWTTCAARFTELGITGYPESHHLISDETTIQAMFEKEPHATYIVSQICFDPETIRTWIVRVRARGTTLPIWIGLPGIVDNAKLVRISMRIGLGESARFLRAHRSWLRRLVTRTFTPEPLMRRLGPTLADPEANVAGFHFYTFNELERPSDGGSRRSSGSADWRPLGVEALHLIAGARAARREDRLRVPAPRVSSVSSTPVSRTLSRTASRTCSTVTRLPPAPATCVEQRGQPAGPVGDAREDPHAPARRGLVAARDGGEQRRRRRCRPRARRRSSRSRAGATAPDSSAATPTAPAPSTTSFARSSSSTIASATSSSPTTHELVEQPRDERQRDLAGALDRDAVGDRRPRRRPSPGCRASSDATKGAQARACTPTTALSGPRGLERARDAAEQPAAADRDDDLGEVRHVLEQLEAQRRLAERSRRGRRTGGRTRRRSPPRARGRARRSRRPSRRPGARSRRSPRTAATLPPRPPRA